MQIMRILGLNCQPCLTEEANEINCIPLHIRKTILRHSFDLSTKLNASSKSLNKKFKCIEIKYTSNGFCHMKTSP